MFFRSAPRGPARTQGARAPSLLLTLRSRPPIVTRALHVFSPQVFHELASTSGSEAWWVLLPVGGTTVSMFSEAFESFKADMGIDQETPFSGVAVSRMGNSPVQTALTPYRFEEIKEEGWAEATEYAGPEWCRLSAAEKLNRRI